MIVLGSGATVGAGFTIRHNNHSYEPPMDRNFFTSDIVKILLSQDSFPALSWYQKSPSLEETISAIDLYEKLCIGGVISQEEAFNMRNDLLNTRAQNDKSYKRKMEQESCLWRLPSMAGWEFRELVSQIFGKLQPDMNGISPLRNVFEKVKEGRDHMGLITFNYDLSFEMVCQNLFVYADPGNPDKKGIPLYKLHGSLNWKETNQGLDELQEIGMVIVEMNYNNSSAWVQPSLIGPTLFKQEITIDFQRDSRAMFYKNLWHMCWDQLQKVDALVFIGFSFPKTDFHVRALFQSIHRVRPFKKVVVCTKDDFYAHKTAKDIFANTTMRCFTNGLEEMAERSDELLQFLDA